MAISLLDNMDYRGQKPNFSRDLFESIEDMKNFSENYLPDVFIAICKEDGLQYKYNRSNEIDETLGKWRPVENGGSADLINYYTKTQIDDLLKEKVDTETGKQLTEEIFTTEEKEKLADLENYDDTALETRVKANEDAIEILNGNDTVTGSVDSKVKKCYDDLKEYADTELDKKVDKVDGKGLSTNDFTTELKEKLEGLENYDATALEARIEANEDAIEILNGDDTVVGSVDSKVKKCFEDGKEYTDESIQNAIKLTAITCDEKPTISGDTITYVEDGETKTTTSDNKTKFYYTSGGNNYSTIWINGKEFTDKLADVDFSEYVSKTSDVVSEYTGDEANKDKVPNLAALDDLKTLVETDVEKKLDIEDVDSEITQSSENPVKSSALYTEFEKKVNVAQGIDNKDKILQVNAEGNLALVEASSTIDLSDYVSKTDDVVSTYTGEEVNKDKVPDLAALDAAKAIIDAEVNKKLNIEDVDSEITQTSENPVKSSAIYDGLSGKVDIAQGVDNKDKILKVNEEGNLVLADSSALGNSAENISYDNDSFPELDNVKKALDDLIAKVNYVEPKILTFTMSPSTETYEVGESVASVSFTWTYNKDITAQTLTGCTLADETVRTASYDTPITSNKTFTLTCSDGTNSASAKKTISFKHKFYYGSAAVPETYDSAFILSLSNKAFATSYKGQYKYTVGTGEFGFFACPKSWGMPSEVYIGGFLTELETVGDFSFTNASGGIETFRIVKTTRSGLGSIDCQFK